MTDATDGAGATEDWRERAFDLARGLAAYADNRLIGDIARVIDRHPRAEIGIAFNHKQVACKMWARDRLYDCFGGRFGRVWVLGGWYGVLAAMLFDDARFDVGLIESFDIDADVAAVAMTLNARAGRRFAARTADMYDLDYAAAAPDVVVNTSCEHIPDLRGWLALLPKGMPVVLQSNDYFSEPSHVSCVASLAEFEASAGLSQMGYAGELAMKKYNRFMLIGKI